MPGALDILGFGASTIDELVYVDGVLGAGKGKVLRRETAYGGNIATALVAAARLGSRAGFVGWLGDQPASLASAADLERYGVDTTAAPRRADAVPIRSTIVVGPDGERFIAYDDEVPHGTCETLPDAVLAEARVLMIDGYAIHSVAVVDRARALGLAVVADIEWSRGAVTDRLMDLADHLVLPIGFARSATGERDGAAILSALWSATRAAVVLTDGDRGIVLRQRRDDRLWHVPAHRVTPVDTTGAGDIFHGAYAAALAEGSTPLDCVMLANAAAGLSTAGRGGRGALPDRPQCRHLMEAADAPVAVPIAGG